MNAKNKTDTQELQLELVRADPATQARERINWDTVQEYIEAIEANDKEWPFPPITIFYDGETHWLADGFHRVAAGRRVYLDTVPADISGGTRRDAILYAAGANANHGLRRTASDKRKAVLVLLNDEEWGQWSDREIARQCGVSHPFVGKVRREVTGNDSGDNGERVYVNKHGQTAVMNTGGIGKSEPEPERRPLASIDALEDAVPIQGEIEAGLRRALHSFADADRRWADRKAAGLDDDDLKQAISQEFGIGGGGGGPGKVWIFYKGGADPRFWYDSINGTEKPTLRGKALIVAVRELLGIPYPTDLQPGYVEKPGQQEKWETGNGRLSRLREIQREIEGYVIKSEPPMTFAYNRLVRAIDECIQEVEQLEGAADG